MNPEQENAYLKKRIEMTSRQLFSVMEQVTHLQTVLALKEEENETLKAKTTPSPVPAAPEGVTE